MEEQSNEISVNVPETQPELPSSKEEEMAEEELLRSPSHASDESPERPTSDKQAREALKKRKRAERRRMVRRKKREEASAERKRATQGDSGREVQSRQAEPAPSKLMETSGGSDSRPGSSSGGPNKGQQERERSGGQAPGGDRPLKMRGPRARQARREERRVAKRRSFVLPSAPAAVRETEAPEDSQGPSGASSPTKGPKRPRKEKETPPERRRKRARESVNPPRPAGGAANVSPLLRGSTGAANLGASGAGPQLASYSSAVKRENQVVIVSSREDGTMTPEEGERMRRHLVSEMLRAMTGPEGEPYGPELRFRNSGLVDPGWFLITTQDEASKRWLLENWRPLAEGDVTFRVMRAADAPWPEQVGFWLRSQEVDLSKVRDMLARQNRSLNVNKWKHLRTTGKPGGWHLIFLVSHDTVRRLEEAEWVLYFELVTLAVRRVPVWSGATRRASPAAEGPGPAEEKEETGK